MRTGVTNANLMELNDEARAAGANLIEAGILLPRRRTYIYMNNRHEGNAFNNISAMIENL